MTIALVLAQQAQQTTPQAASGGDERVMLLVAIVLLIGALGLFVAEVLVPSGGILGFLSACCLVAGVIAMCVFDLTWGLVVGIIAVCALPFAVGFALSIWPDTPIGRWLTLSEAQKPVNVKEPGVTDPRLGQQGQALTDLRPIGACQIGERREQCIAASGMIEAGDPVRVVDVDGMEIRVEKIES